MPENSHQEKKAKKPRQWTRRSEDSFFQSIIPAFDHHSAHSKIPKSRGTTGNAKDYGTDQGSQGSSKSMDEGPKAQQPQGKGKQADDGGKPRNSGKSSTYADQHRDFVMPGSKSQSTKKEKSSKQSPGLDKVDSRALEEGEDMLNDCQIIKDSENLPANGKGKGKGRSKEAHAVKHQEEDEELDPCTQDDLAEIQDKEPSRRGDSRNLTINHDRISNEGSGSDEATREGSPGGNIAGEDLREDNSSGERSGMGKSERGSPDRKVPKGLKSKKHGSKPQKPSEAQGIQEPSIEMNVQEMAERYNVSTGERVQNVDLQTAVKDYGDLLPQQAAKPPKASKRPKKVKLEEE